jgi:hypothetical protein
MVRRRLGKDTNDFWGSLLISPHNNLDGAD